MDKRQQLKIACANAKISIAKFAELNNVTDSAVHQVLTGNAKSKRLLNAVNQFIESEFKKLKVTIGPRKAA